MEQRSDLVFQPGAQHGANTQHHLFQLQLFGTQVFQHFFDLAFVVGIGELDIPPWRIGFAQRHGVIRMIPIGCA